MSEVWQKQTKNGMVQMRLGAPADVSQIEMLTERIGKHYEWLADYPKSVQSFVQTQSCFVAEVRGRIAGFLLFAVKPSECHLWRSGVLPAFEREKIYSAFVLYSIKLGRKHKITGIPEAQIRPRITEIWKRLADELGFKFINGGTIAIEIPYNLSHGQVVLRVDSLLVKYWWRRFA